MAVVSVASTTASIYQSNKAAAAQMKAVAQQRKYQAEEIRAKSEVEIGDRLKATRAAAARARVSAGEAGVAGQSTDMVLQDIFGQSNQDLAIIQQQAFFSDRASESATNSAYASIDTVSGLEAATQIAGAGVNGYQRGSSMSGGSGNPVADYNAYRARKLPSSIRVDRAVNPTNTRGLA